MWKGWVNIYVLMENKEGDSPLLKIIDVAIQAHEDYTRTSKEKLIKIGKNFSNKNNTRTNRIYKNKKQTGIIKRKENGKKSK